MPIRYFYAEAGGSGKSDISMNSNRFYQIAIDGPSGSGKSSLARALAARLNYIYIDTGAMYRAAGLYMYRHGICPRDGEAVAAALNKFRVDISHIDSTQRVYLNGEDVSEAIREHIISDYASGVSSLPPVRAFLLGLQRGIAEKNSVVMDGRDIGTVILPDADVKIFLTAREDVRALRRYNELASKGQNVSLEKVRSDMNRRDRDDSSRAASPAVAAPDAVILDNSDMTETETLAAALEIVKKSIGT